MEKQKSCHIFRNAFVFMESGDVVTDLYRVFKDEISYLLDNKYVLYMDKLYDIIDYDESKFYTYFASVLKKVNLPLSDSTVENLDDYINGFNGMNKSLELRSTLLILRLLQNEVNKLVFDIVEKNTQHEIDKKHGIFVYINGYFECEDRMYESVQSFLNKCYDIVYTNAKLNYGGFSYGKKY